LAEVSRAVQAHAEGNGFSVVRVFVGHGIGKALHEAPQIPNFVDAGQGQGPVLKPGMVLAIEPMINAGGPDVRVLEDRWTAVTADGSLSAHFEHTIAITEQGPEILTVLDGRDA
jgi:methionyl aminopeptidase